MRTTFQELQDLFHLKDNRQIKVSLVNKIKVYEDDIEVTDAKLADIIEKFRNEGSLTLKQVSQEYHVALSEVLSLVKVNKIPYYKLVSQKGSQKLFLRSDLEHENVLNLFIYKGINSVKFVNLILRLFDEMDGISDSNKKLLTQHFVEGKEISEIAKIDNKGKGKTNTLIKKASIKLLHNIRYLNSQTEKAKKFEKKYWELERKFEEQKEQLDFVIDQLNKATPNSVSRDKISFLNTKLIDLDLSVRTLNCLRAAYIDTIAELLQYPGSDLLKFRNFGKKSLHELKDLLKSNGFKLKK
jgi:hypothetical protein